MPPNLVEGIKWGGMGLRQHARGVCGSPTFSQCHLTMTVPYGKASIRKPVQFRRVGVLAHQASGWASTPTLQNALANCHAEVLRSIWPILVSGPDASEYLSMTVSYTWKSLSVINPILVRLLMRRQSAAPAL